MFDGQMGPLGPTTQSILLGTTAMMALPSVMVFLALVLKPALNRPINITLGIVYTIIVVFLMPGAWLFYQGLAMVEIILQLLVV